MSSKWILPAVLLLGASSTARGDDWPTYAHDEARSAVTSESLPVPLRESWVYRAPHPPIPAWPEPARWDGYNKVHDLADRMTFDKAFHVAVVGDSVYFGSSIDDKVYCVDASTGDTRWAFFTEGPVRLAPTIAKGRVYVGSDDGHIYCLKGKTGELVWKHRIGPRDHRVPGNGRIVSLWAVRTGVVVQGNRAYACGGVFPSETVYLCALDARRGDEVWKVSMNDLPAQGYLLGSRDRLYVTTGRERPVVFDMKKGKRLYQVAGGGGGTYALLTGDSLLYGPGKSGQMSVFDPGQKAQVASFAGNHMIVAGSRSYLQTGERLQALNRTRYLELARIRNAEVAKRGEVAKRLKELEKSRGEDDGARKTIRELRAELARLGAAIEELEQKMKDCYLWDVPCGYPKSLILAGDQLFAGGEGRVAALSVEDGRETWHAEVTGDAYGLAVANGRLFVSTDFGTIHCYEPERKGP